MKEKLEQIKAEALAQIEATGALEKLNEIRVAYLGKKGELTQVLKSMKDVAPEDRPKIGQMVNDARVLIEEKIEETRKYLAAKAREEQLKNEVIDVTLPAKKSAVGHRHPNTVALEEVERIFIGMGYEVVEGPEVEYPKATRPATNRTPSTSATKSSCAARPRPSRCVPWRSKNRRSVSSRPAGYSVPTR